MDLALIDRATRNTAVFAVGVFLACLILANVTGYTYFSPAILFADDLNHLPRYFETGQLRVSGKPFFQELIRTLVSTESVLAIRLILTSFIAVIGAAFAVTLLTLTQNRFFSVIASIILVMFPFSFDQGIFIIGSHPLVAALFASISFMAIVAALSARNLPIQAAWLILGVAAAYVSGLSSPTALLMPLAPIAFTVAFAWRRRYVSAAILAGATALSFTVFLWLEGIGYHYEDSGQVDYSLANALMRLSDAVGRILVAGTRGDLSTVATILIFGFWLMLAGVTLLAIVQFVRGDKANRSIAKVGFIVAVALCATIYSALFFGPAAATISYTDRYTFGPGLFAGLAAAMLIGYAFRGGLPRYRTVLYAATALGLGLLIFAVGLRATTLSSRLVDQLNVSRAFEAWSEQEADALPADAQVIIILDTSLASPSSSFIHWSTGLIRQISGRSDITALVGYQRDIQFSLFDEEQQFRTATGVRRRKKMSNFVEGQPIFAYRADADGQISRVPAVFFLGAGAGSVARFGETAQDLDIRDIERDRSLCGDESARPLVWPSVSTLDTAEETGSVRLSGRQTFSENAEVLEFGLEEGAWYAFSAELQPAGFAPMQALGRERFPPTPIHTRQVNMWQRDDSIQILTPTANRRFALSEGPWRVDIVGYEACIAGVWFDGEYVGAAHGHVFDRGLTLGRGFLQRYWSGEIEYSLRTVATE